MTDVATLTRELPEAARATLQSLRAVDTDLVRTLYHILARLSAENRAHAQIRAHSATHIELAYPGWRCQLTV